MDESKQKGNLKSDAVIAVTGAARLAFKGYPATVKIEHGITEDNPTVKNEDFPWDLFPSDENPQIILGADVIESVRDTEDGQLIQYIEIPWLAIAEEILSNPRFLFEFDSRKFEEFIAASYDREGWAVELTPRSGDGGRDVIATRNDFGSFRIYDEVKRYGPGKRVTAEKVRALSGVVYGSQDVSKGVVTTTAEFAPGVWTDKAIAPLMPYRLELRDGKALLDWIASLRDKKS